MITRRSFLALFLSALAGCGTLKTEVDKVSGAVVDASLNVRELTNQFGALYADLYDSNPERRDRARRIFESVIGHAIGDQPPAPKLALTVMLTGVVATPVNVDVFPAGDLRPAWVTSRFSDRHNSAYHENPITVTATDKVPLTKQDIHAEIRDTLTMTNPTEAEVQQCYDGKIGWTSNLPPVEAPPQIMVHDPYKFTARWFQCGIILKNDSIATAVMHVYDSVRIRPPGSSFTYQLQGGNYAAVLARRTQIAALPADTKLEAWVHEQGDPSKRLPGFQVNWKTSRDEWLDHCFDTGDKAVGEICYAFVDLEIAPLTDYKPK